MTDGAATRFGPRIGAEGDEWAATPAAPDLVATLVAGAEGLERCSDRRLSRAWHRATTELLDPASERQARLIDRADSFGLTPLSLQAALATVLATYDRAGFEALLSAASSRPRRRTTRCALVALSANLPGLAALRAAPNA